MKPALFSLLLSALVPFTAPAYGNVVVSSPHSYDTITSPANFAAVGTTSTCRRGIATMAVYVDDKLQHLSNGAALNVSLALVAGPHHAVVIAYDQCGGVTQASVPVTVAPGAGVWVSSPANGANLPALVSYVATATSTCGKGVAAMGVYKDSTLLYTVAGSKLNTQLQLPPGIQHTVVQEWDNCGGSLKTPVTLSIQGGINSFTDLQASTGWKSAGQKAPAYDDCAYPCTGVKWSMQQQTNGQSPVRSAAIFSLGGTTPYSDVLYYNQLIGDFSSQGLPDLQHTLVPSLHNFTYDAYFYLSDATHTQAMEFDVNMFLNSVGMTWGTECRIRGGHEWDIWDNVNAVWVPTGSACHPLENAWNHVTVQVQRQQDNTLLFQSIALNGQTAVLNRTYKPFKVPADWYGVTVNYQMDGDEYQTAISSTLDRLSLTYW